MIELAMISREETINQFTEAVEFFSAVRRGTEPFNLLLKQYLAYAYHPKGREGSNQMYDTLTKFMKITLGAEQVNRILIYTNVLYPVYYRAEKGYSGLWRNNKKPNDYASI